MSKTGTFLLENQERIFLLKEEIFLLKKEARSLDDALSSIFGLLTNEPQWTTNKLISSVVEAADIAARALIGDRE